MSDYRVVAAVTGSLQQFLYGPLSSAVPGTAVRTGPPSAGLMTGAVSAVNIFLYQVNPNPSWRNSELPVRRHDGSVIRRPQVAFDLYYLLSFYGSESKLVPQLLLGAAASALHAHPKLDPASIPEALDGKSLAACGLREQAEIVKFTLVPLTHEELARIWSVFFQVPYTLSLAYKSSVVLLEADLTPEPALPVAAAKLHAAPWLPAHLDSVSPQVIESGSERTLTVNGAGLDTDSLSLRLGDEVLEPTSVAADAMEFRLPATVAAGVHTLRARTGGGVSSPVSLTVQPRVSGSIQILAIRGSGDQDGSADEANGDPPRSLAVPIAPSLGPEQTAELRLFPRPGADPAPDRGYALRASADGSRETPHFPLRGVSPGDYLAQVVVDGVASRLDTDDDATSSTFGALQGPSVRIP